MFFINNAEQTVKNSLNRANIMNENDRLLYATKLLDFYRGFTKIHIQTLIEQSVKNKAIQENMKKLIIVFPLLQNFIEEISAVYKNQPQRKFSLSGKLLVRDIDETLDKNRFEKNPALLDKLEGLYNRKLKLMIKKAEQLTNLLSTTIFKVNFRDDQYVLDFLPNDAAIVSESIEDSTRMDRVLFVKYFDRSTATPIMEDWSIANFTVKGGQIKEVSKPNRATEELQKLYKKQYVDCGFPPFVVFRNDVAVDDFWNLRDKDVLDTIEQILMAFTELRYLQRYGAFGLKYVVGGKLPEGGVLDLTGIIEITPPPGQIPGTSAQVSAGEFANTARMSELSDSIFGMLKFLYDLYGINIDRLVASRQSTTAESKQVDRKILQEYIETQQEIWQVNEENLFQTLTALYNRDHTDKLPAGLSILVDYPDPQGAANDMLAQLEVNMTKVQNNIMSMVDWMREENPDLSEEEALSTLERNKQINDSVINSMASQSNAFGSDAEPVSPPVDGSPIPEPTPPAVNPPTPAEGAGAVTNG